MFMDLDTSSQNLFDVYEQYGEIEEGIIIMDNASGKPRGFGFIIFKYMDSAQRELKEPRNTIDVRIIVSNPIVARTSGRAPQISRFEVQNLTPTFQI